MFTGNTDKVCTGTVQPSKSRATCKCQLHQSIRQYNRGKDDLLDTRKTLWINLTKEKHALYGKNHKILLKDMKEGIHKSRDMYMARKIQNDENIISFSN